MANRFQVWISGERIADFPIHYTTGRCMLSFALSYSIGLHPEVAVMTGSLHSLLLLHRFLKALLENRLEKEIKAMTTGLPDFFQYNLWANLRLLDACTHLSDAQLDATMPGTFGSVRETLMHLFASEEGYVQSFTGTTPTPPLKAFTTFAGFDELRRRAESSGKALITIVEQRDLSQIFHLDGGTYEAPAIIVVIQAINHGIDHRSQIATLLSQQHIELPDLDSWAYNDAIYAGS